MDVDDAELIARSREVPESFAELYDRHAPTLFRFAARRLGDQAAEDVIAETFLAAFRHRDRYDSSRRDARPWLYGIAVKVIGKHRRSELRMLRALARIGVDAAGDTEAGRSDERIAAAAMAPELAAALAGLRSENRDVLLLVAWAELSYEEISQSLEIPIGTVRSRLNRARRQIREALTDAGSTFPQEELSYERS